MAENNEDESNKSKASEQERDHLNDHLLEWAPLINMHVNKMRDTLPPHIDHEDLYAAGMHGLIDAFHKYDPDKGASFKSYASRRVKGKMLDHVTAGGPNSVYYYHYKKAKDFLKQNPGSREGAGEVKDVTPTSDQQTTPEEPKKPEEPSSE